MVDSNYELTEKDRGELRHLTSFIIEAEPSEELLRDLEALSEEFMDAVRSTEGTAVSWESGWSSFEAYLALSKLITNLLLGEDFEESSLEDGFERRLTAAARIYGRENSSVTDDELQEIMDILSDHYGYAPAEGNLRGYLDSLDELPEAVLEARKYGWSDPAAVELFRNFLEELFSYEIAKEIQKIGVEELNEFGVIERDPRADLLKDEHSDDGEWDFREIDSESTREQPEGLLGDGNGHGVHGWADGYLSQILGDELTGNSAEEEAPDEREIAVLALIAEGLLFGEISDVLLKDLTEEAGELIREGRRLGPNYWSGPEATAKVGNLLATVLTGEPWPGGDPFSFSEDDYDGNYIEDLQRFAERYPLDPEPEPTAPPTEEELMAYSPKERYEYLLGLKSARLEEPPAAEERSTIAEIIADFFGEQPNAILVEDVANALSDEELREGRASSFSRALTPRICNIASFLLAGTLDWWSNYELGVETNEAHRSAIREYRSSELTEDQFIEHYDQSRWPSVGATVDLSIFTILDGELQVLLVERGNHPEKGKWALPGGFVNVSESIDEAALRELREETAVDLSSGGYLEQVKTYGYPGRDRRGYIISTLYAALIAELPEPEAGDDAARALFRPVAEVLHEDFPLAFDHRVLLTDALARVRAKIEYAPVAFDFLPEDSFTIEELRGVYETVWGYRLLPSDFRRRISQAVGALEFLGTNDEGVEIFRRGPVENFFPPLDRAQIASD